MFKTFFNSFRWHRDLWKPFLIDAVVISMIILLWQGLGKLLLVLTSRLSDGRSLEDLKAALLNSPEIAQAFVRGTKYLLVAVVGGVLLIAIISLLLISLAQAWIWSVKFDRKKYWRWNALTLLLIFFSLAYSGLIIGLNVILKLFSLSGFIVNLLNVWLVLLLLAAIFVIYHSFARSYSIIKSLNDTITVLKKNYLRYLAALALILVVGLILSTLFSWLKQKWYWQFFAWPAWLQLAANITLVLIYLAWMRFYVSRI